MRNTIRLLIVDDFEVLRLGIKSAIAETNDIVVVGEAGDAETALAVCAEKLPHIVLMDVTLPGIGSLAAIRQIRKYFPRIQIVTMTCEYDAPLLGVLLETGVTGCLVKNCTGDELIRAIRMAAVEQPVFSPEVSRLLINRTLHPASQIMLTPREQEILLLIANGLTNAEIAHRLSISPFTIKNHVSRLLSKLGVNSRTEAAVFALREHLVHSD